MKIHTRFSEDKRIKPLYISHTSDISQEEKSIFLDTIDDILDMSCAKSKIPISFLGIWRNSGCEDFAKNGFIHPETANDFLERHRHKDSNLVNPDSALMEHVIKNERLEQSYYSIILTASSLCYKNGHVIGGSQPHSGAIISVAPFRKILDKEVQREVKRQGIFHEVGHVFGLPNRERGYAIENKLGYHCTNACAVRQNMNIGEWIESTKKRMQSGHVYCEQCTKELQDYFRRF